MQNMTKNKCSHQKQRGTKRKIGKAKSIGIKRTFPSLKTNEEKVPLKQLIAHTKIEVSKSTMMMGLSLKKYKLQFFFQKITNMKENGLRQMVEKESKF